MGENFKLAKKTVEEFEKINNDFINNMEIICKETWKITLDKIYGQNCILLKNDYLKYTSNKKNVIIDMRINKILLDKVENIINYIINNINFGEITFYILKEYRGNDDDVRIRYINNNEYEIIFNQGSEGYGNTYYYLIKKNNLFEILKQIKKYSSEIN